MSTYLDLADSPEEHIDLSQSLPDLSIIGKIFLDKLNSLLVPPDNEVGKWTQFVKEIGITEIKPFFEKNIPQYEICAYPNMAGSKANEWFVDFCLTCETRSKPLGEWLSYHGILLALESEWIPTKEAREQDFAKLADVTACRKVFIGQINPNEKMEEAVGKLFTFISGHFLIPKGAEFYVILCQTGNFISTRRSRDINPNDQRHQDEENKNTNGFEGWLLKKGNVGPVKQ